MLGPSSLKLMSNELVDVTEVVSPSWSVTVLTTLIAASPDRLRLSSGFEPFAWLSVAFWLTVNAPVEAFMLKVKARVPLLSPPTRPSYCVSLTL